MSTMATQLSAAGFTTVTHVAPNWVTAVDPDGWPCAAYRQSAGRWHWFARDHEATASGGSAETCHRGGLGDAIDTDSAMRTYRRAVGAAPRVLWRYAGVRAAMSQVYHECH
jgi:hypothetical protein